MLNQNDLEIIKKIEILIHCKCLKILNYCLKMDINNLVGDRSQLRRTCGATEFV